MREIRRRFTGAQMLQVESRAGAAEPWKPVSHRVALGYESPFSAVWEVRQAIGYGGRPGVPVLPFQPLTVRHFYGSEQAVLEAAYGHLRRILPPVANVWEAFAAHARERLGSLGAARAGTVASACRFGNPLAVLPSASPLRVPAGARALDYVPRLGFVLARALADATPEEAGDAIGAFVLICEFSAVAAAEPRSGAGPCTAAPSSTAEVAIPAVELRDSWRELEATITVNDAVVAELSAGAARVELGELLAAASAGERLAPGECFSVYAFTVPRTLEPLRPGDRLSVAVPGLGHISHAIS